MSSEQMSWLFLAIIAAIPIVQRLAPDAEFHKDIEAQDFHETLARRQEKVALEEAKKALEFPEEI